MMSELAKEQCQPISSGASPLQGKELDSYAQKLGGNWDIVKNHQLEKEFSFKDFVGALEFVNRVGEIAEREQHHPDIFLAWGKVKLLIWTHSIDGLSRSDFILAAKCDQLY